MAIIKLVCQGCGANLDALDTSRIIACGYCGTQNQIKPTVYQEPPPPAPPPPPPSTYAPVQYHVVQPAQQLQQAAARGVGVFLAIGILIPVLVAGAVAFLALEGGGDIGRGQNGGLALAGEAGPERQYRWESGRPFPADVNGDGSEDLIGIIQVIGESSHLSIIALSGADWRVLWETDIGDRATMPEAPLLRFIDDSQTVVFAMGAALRAYDGKTGQSKWVANLPDKSDMILLEGDHLWVRTIDESTHTVALASGQVSPTKDPPSTTAKPLRTDYGYDLIPSNRQLKLEYEQFADVRIETAFCPPELLEIHLDPSHWHDGKGCTSKHGLAWVSRNKGTAVPFLLAYDPATKQERWRIQLTPAGTLETIDQGFNQPRAEFVGDDAVISFSPSNANGAATIRRIGMAQGATVWETTLAQNMTENVDGMVIGKDRVYVDHGGCMVVLDLANGNVIERLGGW